MKGPVSEVKRYGARNLKIVLILLFVLMLIATVLPLPNALAETNTGSISGVVTNPDGGLMPGIKQKKVDKS